VFFFFFFFELKFYRAEFQKNGINQKTPCNGLGLGGGGRDGTGTAGGRDANDFL